MRTSKLWSAVTLLTTAAFGVLLAAQAAALRPGAATGGAPDAQGVVAARDLGLSKVSVTEDLAPEPFVYGADGPGSSTRIPRAYEGAPPLVSHSLDRLVPITREQNWCLLCHVGGPASGGPPQAPESHFVDWRGAPGEVRDEVAGARWVCTSCHVPQTNAPPLVANSFGGAGG